MNDRQNGQQAEHPQPLYVTLILDESGSMQSCKGADHDVWAAGRDLGIAGDGLISFCRRTVDHTFDQLSEATTRYRRGDGQPAADAFMPKKTPPTPAPSSGEQEPPLWLR